MQEEERNITIDELLEKVKKYNNNDDDLYLIIGLMNTLIRSILELRELLVMII